MIELIGNHVSFINIAYDTVNDDEPYIQELEGIVVAIQITPHKRLCAKICTGTIASSGAPKFVEVPLSAIGAGVNSDLAKQWIEAERKIVKLHNDTDDKQRTMVAKANAKTEELRVPLYGEALDFDESLLPQLDN